ncbi:MAG: ABC transporter substrate-binding protein, partial [Reyranella sp.]
MIKFRKPAAFLLAAASIAGLLGPVAAQAETIKAVMNSDLKIVDPIWTTAYVQRGFGYLVWDTLFALDEKLQVQPEMVDKWDVSPDKLTWTFTLRDGLVWSDGAPVTSEDCIQSIKRWGARDSMGQKMLASVTGFEAVDAKTFKMKMKEPYGLVLESLGKPSSNVPFMMPKRVAETDPFTQIKAEDVIGSGPFVFIAKEWKVVFVKNTTYKPRPEPPSGLAGGKIAKVDRIEWIWIPDAQTQVAALQNGEVDMLESPGPDLYPILAADKNIKLFDGNPLGNQYALRFNTLFKPFDNPKIRHAAMVAFNQEDFLKATIGDPKYYKVCKAVFVCGTPLASDEGMADVLNANAAKAKQLLAEAGYDGTPVELLQSTDLTVLTNMAPVAKAQLEAAGFKVNVQAMDWQTLVARRTKKDPP